MKDLYIVKERLAEALKYRDISASELANKAGLNKSTVFRYLNGDRLPRPDAVEKMATALNVDPSFIIGYNVPINSEASEPDLVILVNGKPVIIEVNKLTPEQQVKLASYYNYLLTEQGGADNADSDI